MGKSLPIVALVANTSVQIPLGANADQIQAVRITNESPYALAITNPDNDMYWLAAWMEDIIPVGNGNVLTVVPQVVPGGTQQQGPPSSALLLTVYMRGETVPAGSWPLALARQTNQGNILQFNSQATLFNAAIAHGTGGNLNLNLLHNASGKTVYLTGFTWSIQASASTTYTLIIAGLNTLVSNPTYYAQVTTSSPSYVAERFPYAVPNATPTTDITFTFSPVLVGNGSIIVYGYYV